MAAIILPNADLSRWHAVAATGRWRCNPCHSAPAFCWRVAKRSGDKTLGAAGSARRWRDAKRLTNESVEKSLDQYSAGRMRPLFEAAQLIAMQNCMSAAVWVGLSRLLVAGLPFGSVCLGPAGPPLGEPFAVAVELFEVVERTEQLPLAIHLLFSAESKPVEAHHLADVGEGRFRYGQAHGV